jgi:hypothetical protein
MRHARGRGWQRRVKLINPSSFHSCHDSSSQAWRRFCGDEMARASRQMEIHGWKMPYQSISPFN